MSRLMSWDPRMAEADVWLSTLTGENVFEGNPVWTIDSHPKIYIYTSTLVYKRPHIYI